MFAEGARVVCQICVRTLVPILLVLYPIIYDLHLLLTQIKLE